MLKKIIWAKALVIMSLIFTGCLSDDNQFDPLQGGDIENVDHTTITQFIPDVSSINILQNQSQLFSVTAVAPGGRKIEYRWEVDNTTILLSTVTSYTLNGSSFSIGDHVVKVTASDGATSDSKTWNVKINGAPTITKITTGTPKVSVGSSINIQISASDPNGDPLDYTWTLNGAASSYFVGTTETAVLTGHDSIVGSLNLQVTVCDDGDACSSETWTAEVNYLPMACNQLTTAQTCTYAGSPSVGDGLNPLTNPNEIKTGINGATVDDVGNYFFADPLNNVVWYWNMTGSTLTRIGVTIDPNTIKVVAGTGEPAVGSEAVPALESALNGPEDVYYHQATQTLYIADRGNDLVRMVNSSGIVYNGLGNGTSNVDGVNVYTADCNGPYDLVYHSTDTSIYVACYTSRRVKRWNLSDDNVYNVMGNGTAGCAGDGGAAVSNNLTGPIGLYIDANGVYVADYGCHNVRFVNRSGGAIDFYGATNPASVGNGLVTTVLGTGAANYSDAEVDPLAMPIGNPRGVFVKNGIIYATTEWSNRDRIIAANNSGANFSVGSVTVTNKKSRIISSTTTQGYNGSNISVNNVRFYDPRSLFQDPADSNYMMISDYTNRRLRRINLTTWVITDLIGSGYSRYGFVGDIPKPSMEQLLNNPSDIKMDSNRNLFILDRSNGRIRIEDAYGRVQTAIGRGAGTPATESEIPSSVYLQTTTGAGPSYSPMLAIFDDSSVVFVDRYIIRVWNRLTTGKLYANSYIQPDTVTSIVGYAGLVTNGNPADTNASNMQINEPDGIAIYGSGSSRIVFYSDSRNHCIKSVDNDGNVDTIVGLVDGSNNCSATAGNGINSSSNPLGYGLTNPAGIAVDSSGNLYIADRNNNKIRFLNRTASPITIGAVTINAGQIATIACANGSTGASGEGVFATAARCNTPIGIEVSTNYICFSNQSYHNVRCIHRVGTNAGKIYTYAGSDVASARAGSPFGLEQEGILALNSRLNNPKGVAFDSEGNLYIADWGNHIVRKVIMQNPPP